MIKQSIRYKTAALDLLIQLLMSTEEVRDLLQGNSFGLLGFDHVGSSKASVCSLAFWFAPTDFSWILFSFEHVDL